MIRKKISVRTKNLCTIKTFSKKVFSFNINEDYFLILRVINSKQGINAMTSDVLNAFVQASILGDNEKVSTKNKTLDIMHDSWY